MTNLVKAEGPTRKQAGVDFLLKILADGPVQVQEIFKQASKLGIAEGSIRGAKKELQVTIAYTKAERHPGLGYRRSTLVKWALPGFDNSHQYAGQVAEEFLKNLLQERSLPSEEIHRKSAAAGISRYHIEKAKKDLKVKSVRVEEDGMLIAHWRLESE